MHKSLQTVCSLLFFTALPSLALAPKSVAAEPDMAIRIDGQINDAEWKAARSLQAFTTFEGKQPLAATTSRILTDDRYLYLAFECEEPQMDKLQATPLFRDGALWTNDCIEIYIAPFQQKENYFHIIVDTSGQVFDAFKIDGKLDARYDLSVTAKAHKRDDGWSLEVAIPLAELGLSHARHAFMNFGRERKPITENTAWHGVFGKPETWQTFPVALDDHYQIDVQNGNLHDPAPQYGNNDLITTFTSTANAPVKVLLSAWQNGQWKVLSEKQVSPISGKQTEVALPYLLLPQNQPQNVRYEIARNDHIVFRSTYQLNLPAQALTASLSVPYYYTDEKFGYLQLENLLTERSLKSSNIRLTVRNQKGKVLSRQKIQPLQKSMRISFDISKWQQGTGSVSAELITEGKVLARQEVEVQKREGPFAKSTF